jgi:hypothetical protein
MNESSFSPDFLDWCKLTSRFPSDTLWQTWCAGFAHGRSDYISQLRMHHATIALVRTEQQRAKAPPLAYVPTGHVLA